MGLKMSSVFLSVVHWSTEYTYMLRWLVRWKSRRRCCLHFNFNSKQLYRKKLQETECVSFL